MTLVVLLPLVFGGGGHPELARALGERFHRPVALLVGDDERFRPFRINSSDPVVFANGLRREAGLIQKKDGYGFAPAAFPTRFVRRSTSFGPTPPWDMARPWPIERKEDGKLYVKRSDLKIHSLAGLERVDFGRPVHVHWRLKELLVAFDAAQPEPKELLQTVADAAGATLVEASDGYTIDLDAKAFRSRMVAYLDRRAAEAETEFYRADAAFGREVYRAMTDAQLKELYAKPGEMAIAIKTGTPLMVAAVRRLRAYAEREDISNAPKEGPGSPAAMVAMMDFSKPLRAFVNTNMGTFIQAKIRNDPKGEIGL
jgi:hypothetical protein